MNEEFLKNTFEKIKKAVMALFVPVHSAGWVYVGSLAAATLFLWLTFEELGNVFFALTIISVIYFRAPARVVADNKNAILSPVDGVVDSVSEQEIPESGSKEKFKKLSVFVNFYNAKAIYAPADAEVLGVEKVDDADAKINIVKLKSKTHGEMAIVQNGCSMIPKSLVLNVLDKQKLSAGEEFGYLTFGQYIDLYFPKSAKINVKEGQRLTASETAIANSAADAKMALEIASATKKKPAVKKVAAKKKAPAKPATKKPAAKKTPAKKAALKKKS